LNGNYNAGVFTISGTPTAAGTFSYTVTTTGSPCQQASVDGTITVNPLPVGTASPSTQTICSGTASAINLTSNITPATFSWTVTQSGVSGATNGSGSSIAQTLSATGSSAGTVTYTIIPTAAGCSGAAFTVTVTVNPLPVGTASPTTPQVCTGSSTNIQLLSSITGTTFNWTVISQPSGAGASAGTGSIIAQTLSATAGGTVIYLVTPTVNGCAGTPFNVSVTINPLPTIALTNTIASLCRPSTTLSFLYSSTTGSPNQYSIDYDATANAAGLSDISNISFSGSPITVTVPAGVATGTYNGTLTVRNSSTGCSSQGYAIVDSVKILPTVVFDPANYLVCRNNDAAVFSANASGYPFPNAQWQMSTDNGSTWTNISGANLYSYQFVPGNTDEGKQFRVIFTNSCGKDTSTAAILHVGKGISIPPGQQPGTYYICEGQTITSVTISTKVTGGKGSDGSDLQGTLTGW
jgi:hypothetical protein